MFLDWFWSSMKYFQQFRINFFNVNPEYYVLKMLQSLNLWMNWNFFQLSNVEYGGYTVFPILGLQMKPIKNSALFWYNLHSDGTPDYLTLHGGCPVLFGSKWSKKNYKLYKLSIFFQNKVNFIKLYSYFSRQ